MSACAVIIDRRLSRPPTPPSAAGLMAALAHRGRDGGHTVARPRAALGMQSFRTTAEEPGPEQPLCDREAGVDLLFEGRLDNRDELLPELALPGGVCDARLALAAYLRWGRRAFARLVGPFAIVAYEAARHRLMAARDALGDRTLYYRLGPEELAIASEAAALLGRPGVSARLDETSLARFFTVEAPAAGHTYFADVREIPPGHALTFEDDRLRLERFWTPESLPAIRYRRDAEYVDHFRSLLTAAVRSRLRTPAVPAVLMSGGLDSTSVAALASRELAGERLPAVSWVFDELPEADERRFMDPVIEHCGLSPRRIVGDGEWPLRDAATWRTNPGAPWQGPYWRLQNRAYREARRAGTRVLLTGEFGDHLYLEHAFWLRALLAERRWREGFRELGRELAGRPPWAWPRALLEAGPVRGAVARAAGWRGRSAPARPWLTPFARRLLAAAREPAGRGMLDPLAALLASLEIGHAGSEGVEVRRPFRDRRLIEFMLAVPAHLLYRPGWSKWILRRAMDGVLPEEVRLRRHVSTLLPLAARGLIEREIAFVRELLAAPDAAWRRYVRADWLAATFPERLSRGAEGISTVIPWQCVCMGLWSERIGNKLHL